MTSVKSARQVIDALNAEGPDIDIILAEIDLPMAKGMKMLRYITRDKDLRRIPVISKLCSLLFLFILKSSHGVRRIVFSRLIKFFFFYCMIICYLIYNIFNLSDVEAR